MASKNSVRYKIKVPICVVDNVKTLLGENYAITFKDFALAYAQKFHHEIHAYCHERDKEIVITTSRSSPQKVEKKDLFVLEALIQNIDFAEEISDPKSCNQTINENKYVGLNYVKPIRQVANFFDKWKKWKEGDVYEVYLANVYDPSKMWITLEKPEKFQQYLYKLYNDNNKKYIMKETNIFIGCYCVALIDGLYYRGRLVRRDNQFCLKKFTVYLFDFGMLATVQGNQMFMMDNRVFDVPEFAIRASLAEICTKDNQMWNLAAVNRLIELTANAKLVVKIVNVNKKRKILDVALYKYTKNGTKSINDLLVSDNLAKYKSDPVINKKNVIYRPIVEYLYHFPSFEFIENGIFPSKPDIVSALKMEIPWDIIFKEYYQFIGNDDESLKS